MAFLILIAYAHTAPAVAAAPADALQGVIRDYGVLLAEQDPMTAGQRGDMQAASRWPDDSPGAMAGQVARLKDFDARLRGIAVATLGGEDALNLALLRWQIEIELQGVRFDEARIPFTSDEGFYAVPGYAAEGIVLHDEAAAGSWLARLRALPAYYATETANMRRGIATGFMRPALTARAAVRATQAAADVPAEQSLLLAPFDTLPAGMPQARRTALKAEGQDIVRHAVKPAEQALAAFFKEEYLPHAKAELAAASLPDGRDYYAYLVRRETTTSLTPDEIFTTGQSEIARIRAAMEVQIRAAGFKGDFRAFQAMLRHDPQFYATTPEALLEKASRLAKRVDDQLPRFFGKLPRLSYGVRPVPAAIAEGYTTARYNPGSPEQGIAGGLMINTTHLDQRPLYELPALVAHEGAPGHHIQIALGQELSELPAFRRDSDITAFVEGWAVYSEQLVAEMGMYQTPYERFGMLSMEMWRACRLVMDVGLHWKNITRDEALACLRDNTALAEKNMQNEVDRYIAWPGQALGYKIGELKIMSLRRRAEAALGARFDLRRFHDEVLDEGAMPLSVLEQRVDEWINKGK